MNIKEAFEYARANAEVLANNGETVSHGVFAHGGRHLTMASDGDRVVALGLNDCGQGNLGVRESLESGQSMSNAKCATGNAGQDTTMAITPDRAGVFAGVGYVRDESTFPSTKHDTIELTFFR